MIKYSQVFINNVLLSVAISNNVQPFQYFGLEVSVELMLVQILKTTETNDNWAALWENQIFAYAKTKAQINCAVTAQLISAFIFATLIVQFLFYLKPNFQASSFLLRLYRTFCVRPGRKSRWPVF